MGSTEEDFYHRKKPDKGEIPEWIKPGMLIQIHGSFYLCLDKNPMKSIPCEDAFATVVEVAKYSLEVFIGDNLGWIDGYNKKFELCKTQK